MIIEFINGTYADGYVRGDKKNKNNDSFIAQPDYR